MFLPLDRAVRRLGGEQVLIAQRHGRVVEIDGKVVIGAFGNDKMKQKDFLLAFILGLAQYVFSYFLLFVESEKGAAKRGVIITANIKNGYIMNLSGIFKRVREYTNAIMVI